MFGDTLPRIVSMPIFLFGNGSATGEGFSSASRRKGLPIEISWFTF